MKRTWKNFRLDKNKVYQRIGQAVVYGSLYIAGIAFNYWAFLKRNDLLRRERWNLLKIILDILWVFLLYQLLNYLSKYSVAPSNAPSIKR